MLNFWKNNAESIVRALIAAVVIVVTWLLTGGKYPIAEQWQAVFLMVIGYYFKDRPQSEHASLAGIRGNAEIRMAVDVEMSAQFVMAMLLLFATTWLFAAPQNKEFLADIAGAWVGGVTLAIAFYFKDVTGGGTTPLHTFFRAALAISVGLATLWIFFARTHTTVSSAKIDPLPLQWVALAFVVIAFYFKERGASSNPPPPSPRDPLSSHSTA